MNLSTAVLLFVLPMCALPAAGTVAAAAPSTTSGDAFDHADYDALLKKHVKADRVDYKALLAVRGTLDAYVARLAKLPKDEFEKLARPEQMAFWINAYNAVTLVTILDHYPTPSIKKIDDAWKKKHMVASQQVSLDDIEHEILRKQWKDPRIHAAVNCASIGCPPLRAEAYTGARIDVQLDEQMKKFVTDPLRNTVDPQAKKLEVSKVFDWFGDDFGRKENPRALLDWFEKYGLPEWKPFLAAAKPGDVSFTDYNWDLNDISPKG